MKDKMNGINSISVPSPKRASMMQEQVGDLGLQCNRLAERVAELRSRLFSVLRTEPLEDGNKNPCEKPEPAYPPLVLEIATRVGDIRRVVDDVEEVLRTLEV